VRDARAVVRLAPCPQCGKRRKSSIAGFAVLAVLLLALSAGAGLGTATFLQWLLVWAPRDQGIWLYLFCLVACGPGFVVVYGSLRWIYRRWAGSTRRVAFLG
jgi:nitrate reductase NapE component